MFELGLPLFPFESSAITVTTTVWIGVIVAVFFHLRLGWTLSALVVPGYMVPLLISRPSTAGVILVESVITYLITRLISDLPKLQPYWSNVFGRDRFFLIVVVSVVVRAICDGWLLPYTGRYLVETYHWNFDYKNDLQSFGLIVVALTANYFWKPGVMRGFMPLATCIGITYLIVNYLLVGLTNFNVGNFDLIYEDISVSLMSSPKAYMVIVTTAFFASWINLRYAWDFNGILIPSLLGLLWYDPSKIFISIGECLVIYVVASWLMQTSLLRNRAIQGGYKLVFFFSICFAFRLMLSHVLPAIWPGAAAGDAFGLGYLLSTLMAIKAHDKKLAVRMFNSIIQVSLVGAVAGSLIGFGIYSAPKIDYWFLAGVGASADSEHTVENIDDQTLVEVVSRSKLLLYKKQASVSGHPPLPWEAERFRASIARLKRLDSNFTRAELGPVSDLLQTIGYELVTVKDRYLFLRETDEVRGWGMYVICPDRKNRLNVEVASPTSEWATVDSGLRLFEYFGGSSLAVAGVSGDESIGEGFERSASSSSLFGIFHDEFEVQQPLQVRGMTRTIARKLGHRAGGRSQLWIHGGIPESLKLEELQKLSGEFEVKWNTSSLRKYVRKSSIFAELILTRADRRRLMASSVGGTTGTEEVATNITRTDVRSWLQQIKSGIHAAGTDQYVPAKTEEMLFMDQEVLKPLITLLGYIQPFSEQQNHADWLTDELKSHLDSIAASARVLDYELTVLEDETSGEHFVALHESVTESLDSKNRNDKNLSPVKGWGCFLFRPGLVDPLAVEIPRPLFETRSFDFGVNLFHRPRATALLIAGAHPATNLDGSADISKTANRVNMFNLVRHVLLRHLGDRPFLLAQARAIQAPVRSDIVIATDNGDASIDTLSPLKQKLVEQLNADKMSTEFSDGREATAGYELGIMMKTMATNISRNAEVISLWLSPALRARFRQQSNHNSLAAQLDSCGIEFVEGSLNEFVVQRINGQPVELPIELREKLTRYVENYDVLKLYSLVQTFSDWNFRSILDPSAGQVFLAVGKNDTDMPVVMNLTGFINDSSTQVEATQVDGVSEFIRSRSLWLEVVQ